MFQQMKKRIKNEKGLTLIELLAVIVILAIVAAIAIPAIGNIIAKQEEKSILADTSTVLNGAKLAKTNGECPEGTGTAAGTYTCNSTVLTSYIDNKANVAGLSATYTAPTATAEGSWTITNTKLADIKKLTLHGYTEATKTITEAGLLKSMGKE